MKEIFAIAKRELENHFTTPVGWIVLFAFSLIGGLLFISLIGQIDYYQTQGYNFDINKDVIPSFFSSLILLVCFICPALSMRIFSVDMQQKSFALLLSSPLSGFQIVMGKFIGAMGYILVSMSCVIHFTLMLFWVGEPDLAIVLLNYLAVVLTAACCLSIGMFWSSCTPNQLLSFSLGLSSILLLFFFTEAKSYFTGNVAVILASSSVFSHVEYLCQGLLRTTDLIYFYCFTTTFLFATQQRVEAYRW